MKPILLRTFSFLGIKIFVLMNFANAQNANLAYTNIHMFNVHKLQDINQNTYPSTTLNWLSDSSKKIVLIMKRFKALRYQHTSSIPPSSEDSIGLVYAKKFGLGLRLNKDYEKIIQSNPAAYAKSKKATVFNTIGTIGLVASSFFLVKEGICVVKLASDPNPFAPGCSSYSDIILETVTFGVALFGFIKGAQQIKLGAQIYNNQN